MVAVILIRAWCCASIRTYININFDQWNFASNHNMHIFVNTYTQAHTHTYTQHTYTTHIQEPCDDPMFSSGPRTKLLLHRSVGSPLTSPQKDEWEIPANEVIMEDLLGEGAFGEVYKGIIKCPIINPKVRSSVKNAFCTPVAIKLLKCKYPCSMK